MREREEQFLKKKIEDNFKLLHLSLTSGSLFTKTGKYICCRLCSIFPYRINVAFSILSENVKEF